MDGQVFTTEYRIDGVGATRELVDGAGLIELFDLRGKRIA